MLHGRTSHSAMRQETTYYFATLNGIESSGAESGQTLKVGDYFFEKITPNQYECFLVTSRFNPSQNIDMMFTVLL